MKIKSIVATAIILAFPLAKGQDDTCFKKIDNSYQEVPESRHEVANMPKVRSQDSSGACSGLSSAAVAQHYVCEAKKLDCQNLSPEQTISPFSMLSWMETNRRLNEPHEVDRHTNIRFNNPGWMALSNAAETKRDFSFDSDSCYPFDQFANKYGSNEAAVKKMIDKFENYYNKNKTEGTICEDCLKEDLKKDLLISAQADDLKQALSKDTFGEFLYRVVFRNCPTFIKVKPSPKFNSYPQNDDAKYEDLIGKIKEVMTEGRPINLSGICPLMVDKKCKRGKSGKPASHDVVISGYRKMCKPSGACRDVLKIHNSWGQAWQDQYDGGWVDAESLLKSAADDNGKFEKNMLAWYTKP
jgi:hypothetical protein